MRNSLKCMYALLLSFSVIAFTISEALPAQAAAGVVASEFKANSFGLWKESTIYANTRMGSTNKQNWCTGLEDPKCAEYDSLYADLILPPCVNELDRACVESIEAKNSNSVMEKLTLYGESTGQKIASYKVGTRQMPAGGGLSVWKSSELNPDGSEKFYAAHVLLRLQSVCDSNTAKITCPVTPGDFKGSVFPVSIKPGTNCREFALQGKCVDSMNFTGSERISLTLRMNNYLTGWIFGRMQNADFSVSPIDYVYNQIRIEGDVTLVPELKASVAKSDIAKDPKLEKFLTDFFTIGRAWPWGTGPGSGSSNDNGLGAPSKTYPDFLAAQTITRIDAPPYAGDFDLFSAFESYLKPFSPKAENVYGLSFLRETNSIFWNISAIANNGFTGCSNDQTKLLGLVVTNAPIFDRGPPQFKDGTLNYRVAGIHLNNDGTLFKGSYTYIVRADTARCYYGFSNAPIAATVEVVSADNSTQVATVLVSENATTGFIKLQAENFTFSSPTIKVKLTQENPVVIVKDEPAKVETAKAPSAAVVKKVITITCTKGKTIKKFSGANPKCPAGYRKR